jgi:hypothetical protein
MRSPKPVRTLLSALFLLVALCSGLDLKANEPDDRVSLTNRRFAMTILPHVSFRDADLPSVLRYLKRKAEQESQGALKIPFILELPADFKPRYEITLEANALPYSEVLRYVADQAGVRLSQENGAVYVRPDTARPSSALPQEQKPSVPKPVTTQEQVLTGALGKPAETVAAGDNIHRNTAGDIQPEKSGYIPRRGLNGFAEGKTQFDVNCARTGLCPSANCGCAACTCSKR